MLLFVVLVSSMILWGSCLLVSNPGASWAEVRMPASLFAASDILGSIVVLVTLAGTFRLQERVVDQRHVRTEA